MILDNLDELSGKGLAARIREYMAEGWSESRCAIAIGLLKASFQEPSPRRRLIDDCLSIGKAHAVLNTGCDYPVNCKAWLTEIIRKLESDAD
jgi:hypothetical protein